ncbi:TIGR04219 family outer membrane beta-barrel protein [Marinimicrobium sp. ABcell2]|uniref:TIGR04219 family outer membrane beta-barrel protein n=1 Tax=Marinimicrobium sp. ABcell2 TaxID=3069751 RepID=UPI0027B41650|nr:TIGR04219 family outer membrane beta-barrel protein [Marinimicrobium sp. ABcell2]MDQ2075524.1 TIGR04219 family outer membrane beta-barrel protein [Marinimicrobium sp. ABcell2]
MKKLILATGLALASPFASADLLALHAGAGYWQGEYSGQVGNPSISAEQLGLEESDNMYVYLAFEHFLPVLPNARVQHTRISSSQTSRIDQTFTLDNQTYFANEEVATDLDLTHTDLTLYYQIMDNWVTLNLGLTLRLFDGYIRAEGEAFTETVDIDQAIPMVYGQARFRLPFSGWSVGAQGNVLSFNDHSVTDVSANVGYTFRSAIDAGIELGYRQLSVEMDNGGAHADMDLKGPYAAVTLKF